MPKAVAELRLHLLRRGAKRRSAVRVVLDPPEPDGDAWCCPVLLERLAKPRNLRILGVDSWQAMILALRLIEIVLHNEARKGGRFFYLGEETTVSNLFASRISTKARARASR